MEPWHRISIFFHVVKTITLGPAYSFCSSSELESSALGDWGGGLKSWRRNCTLSNAFLYLSGISFRYHRFVGAGRTSFRRILCTAFLSAGCEGSWLRTSSGTPWSSICNDCAGGCSGCSSAFLFIDVAGWSALFSSTFGRWRCSDSAGPLKIVMGMPFAWTLVIVLALHSFR